MTTSMSSGLKKSLVSGASLVDSLYDTQLVIYNGATPASADASVEASTVICTIADPSILMLSFDSTSIPGTLSKPSASEWSGIVQLTDTATYFRIQKPSDDGSASTDHIRLQGTVNTFNATLNLNPNLVQGSKQFIDFFAIGYAL